MSIVSRFLNQQSRPDATVERRSLTGALGAGSSFIPPPSVGVIDDFVGVHRAMSNMTVFACVRLLADTIASLPWKAYRRDSKGVPKPVNPQPQLITQPYPGFDLFEWKWMTVASMALRGNSYSYVAERDRQGYPTAILPLHPDIVFLERQPDLLKWFEPIYRIMGEAVPREDMVHMRRFTMPGEPWGMSPIRQAAVAVQLGLSAEEFGLRFYKESATPSGTLSTEQDLDEPAIGRLQQNWIQSHGGRRLPAILTKGFKFEPISLRPDESQFLETRQFQRSEICLLFGVPPILIGDTKETTAWGTGVSQITLGAVTYTFRPWTSLIESIISSLLPRGQFVRFDYNALLRGDVSARYDTLKTGIQSTLLTPNEARASEEMDPVSNGDELLVPPGFLPLGAQLIAAMNGGAGGGGGGSGKSPAAAPKKPTHPGTLPMPPIGGGENSLSPLSGNGHRAVDDDGSGVLHDPFAKYQQELRVASGRYGKTGEILTREECGDD